MALKEELAAKQVAVQELGKGLTQLTHLHPHPGLTSGSHPQQPQTGL